MIIYLHGFNSSPASHKARTMASYMRARGVGDLFACLALPPGPLEAVRTIEAELARHASSPTFVGSSLGGFYATHFAERLGVRAVLINPAITPHIGLEAYLGTQKNLYTGETYELTRADLEAWRTLVVERADPERYLLLLETGDEILDWREAARKYEGARTVIRDGGDHTLQSFPDHLPRILAFAGIAVS
ncbi:MAG TPA: YqiA/YcfP family alpha/beta fold hydrolase [Burkholderiales bacterium]|nr:YqiA/YcfP family alpha/beta fold hydrolase [Burkholderiales bacterium]